VGAPSSCCPNIGTDPARNRGVANNSTANHPAARWAADHGQRVHHGFTTAPRTASVYDIAFCLTDPCVERLLTVEHDVPTGLLDIANVQVNRVIEEPRRIAASGRLITIEHITMMLLAAELKNVDR
jgi:hypothetical protein